jgi:gluconolactonase
MTSRPLRGAVGQTLAATLMTPRWIAQTDAHEGPVYVAAEHTLYFTTQAGAIKRLDLATGEIKALLLDAHMPNGMTLGHDGRLILCEQGSLMSRAAISAIDRVTGAREVLVDNWRGEPLNSPNDVVVRHDGTIWFTDPSYGHLQGFRPEPRLGDYVYRHDPATGVTEVVDDSFLKPNGIAFSPDGNTLYVTDSGANQEAGSFYVGMPHHIVALSVTGEGRLTDRRLLAVTMPGFPDGLKTDGAGRVYASAFSGVQVFSPAGNLLDEIDLPGAVNFTFAGDDLLITADTAVWSVSLDSPHKET